LAASRHSGTKRCRPSHPVGLIRLDGEDDVQRYAKTIRAWLEANDGRSADRPSGGRALPALT
jgi:hypothetical protein